jgi:DNA repair protein RecN (Recombination protein N)
MLETLYVKDFAIVEHAEIHFGEGLTVVTGETGAGKSLLVDALLLLAGSRGDSGLVRHGCDRAELSARFAIDGREDLLAWLRAEELDDDSACELRRVIRSEGSSRAWINGRPVALAQLKALGERLIEIHGQHEHQTLLDRAAQMDLLDAFGGHDDARRTVTGLAQDWRQRQARIAALTGGADHAERIDWLSHQLAELDRHALDGEAFAALEDDHRRLANAGQLVQGCAGLAERIDGDGEFALTRLLHRAQADAQRLAELDPRLGGVADLLDAARIQVEEAGDTLTRYQDALDLDPERLAEIEAQLTKLHELSRKHRRPMAELKPLSDELRNELDALRGAGDELERLRGESERIAADYERAAAALSQARAQAGDRLATAVTALMGELGMAGRFEVQLEPDGDGVPSAAGRERCELLVSTNPGQPPRALRKVASGGELSRIGLAIEVAALGADATGTMVFDEVDSGVGGAVAEIVGQKLRRLAAGCQVLCVTHLPQVAAQAHHHLRVAKSSDADSTRVQIEPLDEGARRDEVARMLGGVEITRQTLAHARQMLDSARQGG